MDLLYIEQLSYSYSHRPEGEGRAAVGGGGGLLKQNVKIVGSPRAASYLPFISCLSIYSGVRELMDGKITSRAGNPQSRVPTSVRAK